MAESIIKELEDCRARRTQIRRLVTISMKRIEEILKSKPDDREVAEVEFAKLQDKVERLFLLDQRVSDLILNVDSIDEKEIEDEFDKVEEYRDKWVTLVTKMNGLNPVKLEVEADAVSCKSSCKSSKSGKGRSHHLKLFKLESRKFDGSLLKWIGFWAMFKTIDEDSEIEPEVKFQYLIQSTLDGSPARELLDSFPPSAENYPKAIEQLKNRFGRKDLLIELYVRELMRLVLVQASGERRLPIGTLYDRLETQLRALESMGVAKDDYGSMLTPLVESTLPEDILKEWERERSSTQNKKDRGSISRIGELLTFLRKEVESEERLNLARNTFSHREDESVTPPKNKKPESSRKPSLPTATGLVNLKPPSKACIFCEGQHGSECCIKAHDIPSDQILSILQNNGLCFLCFKKGHAKPKCRVFLKCIVCGARHNPLLCSERKLKNKHIEQAHQNLVEQNLSNTNNVPVLLQTLRVKIRGEPDYIARVLIDSGSQRSYVRKEIIGKIGYQPVRQEKLVHALFGGRNTETVTHQCLKLRLSSLNEDYRCNFEVLDSEAICSAVPAPAQGPWCAELRQKGITLTDHGSGPIDLLIGADVAGKLLTGRREVLSCGLVALETSLGWTLIGRVKEDETSYMNVSMLCSDLSPTDLWRLDILGIEDPIETKSREDLAEEAKEHFLQTIRIHEDGRYEVQLPWIEGHPPLPRNYFVAKKRLDTTLHKLKSCESVQAYEDVFSSWLQEGIIEEVPQGEWDVGHYLPHRPVFKPDSTTSIRPVFDASCKSKNSPSLNSCLEKGLNLIELIPSILRRFRLNAFGVVSDIRKAFLQISVHPTDRDFLRFLWCNDSDGKLRVFRHARVVFGVTTSPFLLGAVIDYHLDRIKSLILSGHTNYSEHVLNVLQSSFYVDNLVTSFSGVEELREFIKQATDIFKEGCFDLRGWEHTDSSMAEPSETLVLGVIWDRKFDKLSVNFTNLEDLNSENITRRTILSVTQRVFDPIGFVAPTTLIPKILVQKTWAKKGGWDDEVDEETRNKFKRWVNEIESLRSVQIPRWFTGYDENVYNKSLHVFCDASQDAYATVIFLRIERNEQVFLHLVEAKARVAPLKKASIPRLELLAATIGARLAQGISKDIPNLEVHFWSDSSTVLAWINREEPWGLFVFNRVKEILQHSKKENWHHVPGSLNPADLISRGCYPKALVTSRWWEGPSWLMSPSSEWPSSKFLPDENEVMLVRKKTVALMNSAIEFSSELFSNKFSSYHRILRQAGWMIRFLWNKFSKKEFVSGDLKVFEIVRAEIAILRMVQDESFCGLKDRRLSKLKPWVDSSGLIRLRTKIWARKDTEDFRSPIILSPDHVIVSRLILETHTRNGHVVGQTLVSLLRERFWILRCRQAVRRIVKQCAICQRHMSTPLEVETPPLPENRVRDARVFEISGTDFAGPFYLNSGVKVYVCIFTCAVYRAVYIDLVTSLSTEAFMLAFRRFVSRHGWPSVMYSDNDTNFRGMNNAIRKIDWDVVASSSTVDRIEWRFNPATAAWWGGFLERMVGVMKTLLKKVLGRASLSFEELRTVLCECEAHISSRPITYISEDPEDPMPITPMMFLQEIQEVGVPDIDRVDAQSLSRKLKYRFKIKEELRKRFRSEYLGVLNLTSKGFKNKREPLIGEIVLLGNDQQKRINWPLAIVDEIIPGRDGKSRVAKLRTAEGLLTRPIQNVFPLELRAATSADNDAHQAEGTSQNSTPDVQPQAFRNSRHHHKRKPKNTKTVTKNTKTRSGREVRIPVKLFD